MTWRPLGEGKPPCSGRVWGTEQTGTGFAVGISRSPNPHVGETKGLCGARFWPSSAVGEPLGGPGCPIGRMEAMSPLLPVLSRLPHPRPRAEFLPLPSPDLQGSSPQTPDPSHPSKAPCGGERMDLSPSPRASRDAKGRAKIPKSPSTPSSPADILGALATYRGGLGVSQDAASAGPGTARTPSRALSTTASSQRRAPPPGRGWGTEGPRPRAAAGPAARPGRGRTGEGSPREGDGAGRAPAASAPVGEVTRPGLARRLLRGPQRECAAAALAPQGLALFVFLRVSVSACLCLPQRRGAASRSPAARARQGRQPGGVPFPRPRPRAAVPAPRSA